MEKIELKTGMFVELENGSKGVVVNNDIVYQDGTWDSIDDWDNNLKANSSLVKNRDIVKVYNCKSFGLMMKNVLLWEAPRKILTDEEREYLKSIIKPFRDRIECIVKWEIGEEFIEIELKPNKNLVSVSQENEAIQLPYFNKDSMYKGMEVSREYSLEELSL